MLTGVVLLMPLMGTAFDSTRLPRTLLVLRWNSKASGVVSAAAVVTVNEPGTPPTFSVALAPVRNWLDDVRRTRICWLLTMDPAADVNVPPSIEYSPPAIETGAYVLMPWMATLPEDTEVARSTSTTGANWNASGVVSAARVVPVNDPDTPPIVSVAIRDDEKSLGGVRRTVTCWLLVMVPAALVKAPPSMEYSPNAMLIGAAALMPVMATLFEVTTACIAAPVTAANWKASGVLSSASVVAVKVADTPPTVSTAFAAVENWPEEPTRTVTTWLLLIVPAAEVNAPPSIEYWPPVIEIAAAALMPVMVAWLDVTCVDNAASDLAPNAKLSGVVSTGGGVGEPPPPPPPQPASSANNPIDATLK